MVSNRTINGECINEEGKQGGMLADGATAVYVTGREFEDVFPLWDWTAVPGTAEAHAAAPPANLTASCAAVQDLARGQHFVGGASDGWDGAAAMDFAVSPLHLHRSWFFAGGSVLLMSAGAQTAPSPLNVTLSLDQRWLDGPVTVQLRGAAAAAAALAPGTQAVYPASAVDWVHHSRIGFVPLAASTGPPPSSSILSPSENDDDTDDADDDNGPWVSIGGVNRTGSWANITQGSDVPVLNGQVFAALLDHGRSSGGGGGSSSGGGGGGGSDGSSSSSSSVAGRTISHEVALLPGIEAADMGAAAAQLRNDTEWLQRLNTFEAQAACWVTGGDEGGLGVQNQPPPRGTVTPTPTVAATTTTTTLMQATLWYANATAELPGCWSLSLDEAPSSPGGLVVMVRRQQQQQQLANSSQSVLLVTVADPHAVGGRAVVRLSTPGAVAAGHDSVGDHGVGSARKQQEQQEQQQQRQQQQQQQQHVWVGDACTTEGGGGATLVTVNLPTNAPGVTPGQGLGGKSVTVTCNLSGDVQVPLE